MLIDVLKKVLNGIFTKPPPVTPQPNQNISINISGSSAVNDAIADLMATTKAINDAIAGMKVEIRNQGETIGKHGEMIGKQGGEIAFLTQWVEVNTMGIKRIQEIQMLQEDQNRKLKNLERKVNEEILPKLDTLEAAAPADYRNLIINFRKRVKSNLTRAGKRVG